MENPLIRLRSSRHLKGETGGMFAVCSSHPLVLEVAIEMAVAGNRPLLVEATANQVNPSGGYTGMTPADYVAFIRGLAESAGLPASRLIIGADHLGPHVWKNKPAVVAMGNAIELVEQCVAAGFHKIHLDTGECCADDPGSLLPPETAAGRAAILCLSAEAAAKDRGEEDRPIYVIGNEVPAPGGGLEEGGSLTVTDPERLIFSVKHYERAFRDAGLSTAWERVVAVVAQPGVDFGDRVIAAFHRKRAAALSAAHDRLPGFMIYEIHATDYQTPTALRQMVADHFLLLKVGPCLTFAFREAVFALSHLEDAWIGIRTRSNLRHLMETLMKAHPEHWQSHYRGETAKALSFLRRFSYRDRIRYYWAHPKAVAAVDRLIENLTPPFPHVLLRQYFPDLFPEIECGALAPSPRTLIKRRIQNALQPYADACR